MFCFLNIILLFAFLAMCAGQKSVSITYYEPGTNCTVAANERVGFASTGACLPQENRESCLNKWDQCGLLLVCNPSTVTFEYWYTAGDACLRGDPQYKVDYAAQACLSPPAGFTYKNYDQVLVCNA